MHGRQRASRHDQAAIRGARERGHGALDFSSIAYAEGAQFHPQRRRHGLDGTPRAEPGGYGGIANDRRSRHVGRDLFEQLQPFTAHSVFLICEPGRVAAGTCQAFNEAGPNRIRGQRKHDRYGASRLQQRRYDRAPSSQDDVRRERDQFRRVSAKEFGIARAPTILDPDVAADGPTQLLQALQERRVASLSFRIVRAQVHEHADAPHPLALLRMRRERPSRRRAAEQRDELAPLHSITSSAMLSSVGGTVRPNILAVWALMTNSNLLDCTTGK